MSWLTRARVAVVSVVLLAALTALSSVVGLAQGQLQLGGQSYSRAAARSLAVPVTGSVSFFRGVGGVAFSAVAEGQSGQVVTSLRYDPTAADGERLIVAVRAKDGSTQSVRGQIYDWQLVPLAEYALDEHGSAVTLFGRLQDDQLQRTTLDAGGRVINYHPKLDNTLLGLRLFQADILIIQPNAADLFRQNGRIVFGAGEGGHDLLENRQRFQQIVEWQHAREALGQDYQSYVVGDLGQRVTFAARGGAIAFTGDPYWNAWRRKYRAPEDFAQIRTLESRFNERLQTYRTLYASMEAGKTTRQAGEPRLTALERELDAIEAQLDELESIEQMPEYSRALTERIRALSGINPVVYQTLRTVMHYRALFKHYQAQNAHGFTAFVGSLARVPVSPSVATPTIQMAAAPQ
jgi:hypothetical protein